LLVVQFILLAVEVAVFILPLVVLVEVVVEGTQDKAAVRLVLLEVLILVAAVEVVALTDLTFLMAVQVVQGVY
jgi:hypothetical protein